MKQSVLYSIFIYTVVSVVFMTDVIFPFFPDFRYLKYIGLPFALILLFTNSFKSYEINDLTKPFLLLILSSLVLFPLLTQQGLFELIFIFAGIAMFLFKNDFKFDMTKLSYFSAFLFVVFYGFGGFFDFSKEAFYGSRTSSVEGGLSFIFGFLAIYFWENKNKQHFILNFLLLLLSLKRIVLIGVIVVILLTIIPKRFSKFVTNRVFLIGFNIVFVYVIQLFVNGYFDGFIREFSGLSAGHFTSGRNTLFALVLNEQVFSGFKNYLFGIGQGGTTNVLADFFGHIFLLHNDIVKILVEHGYIIFISFLFLLYKTNNEKILRASIFLNILYLTDNALIYQGVYLMYFLITYKYEKEKQMHTIKENWFQTNVFRKIHIFG